jgi:hypothetical protein
LLNQEKRPLLLPSSRESIDYMLNIGVKVKVTVDHNSTYIHKCYIPKKAKGKGEE